MTKNYLLLFATSMLIRMSFAQKQATVLQVPGMNQFCTINEKGVSVLPSGRYVTPAGNMIRITNDPFGMAVSPNGKKAITLHNGVFTVIDLATLKNTRVPGYQNKINSPLAHEPLSANPFSADSINRETLPGVLPEGSFIGVAFAADSKIVYLSGGDDGSVVVYDIEKFQRIQHFRCGGRWQARPCVLPGHSTHP